MMSTARTLALSTALAICLVAFSAPASADVTVAREHLRRGEYTESLRVLKPLAEAGDPAAMNAMGFHLSGGYGIAKDKHAAAQWYRKAAEKGHAEGQYNFAGALRTGAGVAKDAQQAAAWYRKSADQGDADAQRELGYMYVEGEGVSKDPVRGLEWQRKAADQGDGHAQHAIGWAYSSGTGVAQDQGAAVIWYRKAAEQGNAYAQRDLASMYRRGVAVRSDAVIAYAWIDLAASAQSAHPKAAEERDAMVRYLPPDLLTEGRRLAREWKPGRPLGSSKLKPVEVAPLIAAWGAGIERAVDAKLAAQNSGPYPARPEARAGLTTCNTKCTNGDCYRTYGDGRQVRFQARQKWNPISNRFEWDAGNC